MKKLNTKLTSAIALTAIAFMTFLSGCEYEFVEPEYIPPPTDTVSFATEVMPIFNASCNMSGCHATGAFEPDLSPANAYSGLQNGFINTADPASSLIYTAMSTGSMKSFTTAAEASVVLGWIQQGALNN
ncbi:MAG: hypothetical protein IPH20_04020 [Bacteroidales bacterium]|nr:hypothetical protein [Bacteroidales bacterium]